MRSKCKRDKRKKKSSCVPFVLILLGVIILILSFVPAHVILMILSGLLIIIGLCLCFSC